MERLPGRPCHILPADDQPAGCRFFLQRPQENQFAPASRQSRITSLQPETHCPNQSCWFKLPLAAEATPVNEPDYCRQYALECLRLANETREPGTKAVLIDMAQAWIKLSDQAQRNRRRDLVHPAPARTDLPAAS
jgi:hypothetical protein